MWLAAKARGGLREDTWPWRVSVLLTGSMMPILPMAGLCGPEFCGISREGPQDCLIPHVHRAGGQGHETEEELGPWAEQMAPSEEPA